MPLLPYTTKILGTLLMFFSVAQIMMNTYTGMSEIEKKFASPELASDRALKMVAKASVLALGIAGVANI